MLDTLKIDLDNINSLQFMFVNKVISDIWWEKLQDWNVSISRYWTVCINDMYLGFDDFIMIAKYNIPLDITMERYDMKSLQFQTERVEKAIKEDKRFRDTNIINFCRHFLDI